MPTDETFQQSVTEAASLFQEATAKLPPKQRAKATRTPRPADEFDLHWTFREVESILAIRFNIASSKRTTFASRLKNFHRTPLNFPLGFRPEQGKVARYTAGDLAMMALAMEMTSLGLSPERIVNVLASGWYPTAMAMRMAASYLIARPEGFDWEEARPETDPVSMFLFLDPSALSPLTFDRDPALTPDLDKASMSYFYGGEGVVRDMLPRWTSGHVNRLSLINVTGMLDNLSGRSPEDATDAQVAEHKAYRREFFQAIIDWSEDFQEIFTEEARFTSQALLLQTYFHFCAPKVPPTDEEVGGYIDAVEGFTGLDPVVIRRELARYYRIEVLFEEKRRVR